MYFYSKKYENKMYIILHKIVDVLSEITGNFLYLKIILENEIYIFT